MQRGPDLSKAVRTRRAWQACPVDQDKRADGCKRDQDPPACAIDIMQSSDRDGQAGQNQSQHYRHGDVAKGPSLAVPDKAIH
jgi:hypothetical protein